MSPTKILVALAVNLVMFIVLAAIVEAMRRRQIDPIGRIAAILSPAPAAPAAGAAQ